MLTIFPAFARSINSRWTRFALSSGSFSKSSFFVVFLLTESLSDTIIPTRTINRAHMMPIRNAVDRPVNELSVANIIPRRGMRPCKKPAVDSVLLSALWIFF